MTDRDPRGAVAKALVIVGVGLCCHVLLFVAFGCGLLAAAPLYWPSTTRERG